MVNSNPKFNPVKNWEGHPNKFPLDQKTAPGYCWDKQNNSVWYWDRFQCPEKIIGGAPYVQLGAAEFCKWEKKADLLAERFLKKPDVDCFLSYKDGDRTNANLFNLEWTPKEKKWLGEVTNNTAGIRGIAVVNKKLRNGTIVQRYRVKTTAGERNFPTKQEAIKYLEESTAGGDDALTVVDSDEFSVFVGTADLEDAVEDTFSEKEEIPIPNKENDLAASIRHNREVRQMDREDAMAYEYTGAWDAVFKKCQQGHSTWRAPEWNNDKEVILINWVKERLLKLRERKLDFTEPWIKSWLDKQNPPDSFFIGEFKLRFKELDSLKPEERPFYGMTTEEIRLKMFPK